MKKGTIILCAVAIWGFPTIANANSSWRWISETRPWDILPYVVAITLLIEIASIVVIAKIKPIWKVSLSVVIANLLSFAAPYLLAYSFYLSEGIYDYFAQEIEYYNLYSIGIAYFLITLLVELPVVYYTLKENATSRKRLMVTIICANILTTLITAIVERIFCQGTWPFFI